MVKETKNVFISHVHEDDDGLKDLKDLLSDNGVEVRDSSITSNKPNKAKDPDYIKQAILAPAINWAGIMLVYISPGTKESEYVNWEIDYAHHKDKRIVGVDWDLKGVAIIGYESHNNARSILDNRVGNETADGNYRSIYISPSLELAWFYELGNGFDFQPSARVAYTYGRYGDYKESGTISSSLRFYDRDEMSIFDSRLQLALTRSFADDMGNISARGGTTYTRYSDNDIGVSRPNGGGSTSYRVPGDEAVNTRYVGASLRYAVGSMIDLTGDVEYHGAGGTKSLSGYLRLDVRF